MSDDFRVAPPTTGMSSGVDAGTPLAFEPADEHWRLHDLREVAYWRSRPPEESDAGAGALLSRAGPRSVPGADSMVVAVCRVRRVTLMVDEGESCVRGERGRV
jgi:hypothetical protein